MWFLLFIQILFSVAGAKVYRMQWKDAEAQSWMVKMYDLANPGNNPYNIQYSIVDNGNGTQTVSFTYVNLPGDADNIRIAFSADGGATFSPWTDYPIPPSVSPLAYTLPVGDYIYLFQVQFSDPIADDEQFVVNELIEQIEELTPTGHPLDISVVNNELNKFQPVKAKQAVMRFLSNASINLLTFRNGPGWDTRFYVEVYKNGRFVLKGYPVMDDVAEPFLAPRNEVSITITDRLGTLKDRELKDLDDTTPKNEKRIAAFYAMALRLTGLNLPINVVSNLREEHSFKTANCSFYAATSRITISDTNADGFFVAGHTYRFSGSAANNVNFLVTAVSNPFSWLTQLIVSTPVVDETDANCVIEDLTNAGNWFDKVYLHSRTWEGNNVGECIKAYPVLEGMLGNDAFVTQEKGEWWIIRVDERDAQPFYVTRFDALGNFVEDQPGQTFEKTFGRTQSLKFIDRGTDVRLTSAKEFAKLTYRYENPKEIVCNISFERGNLIATISPTEKHYALDCWTLREGMPGAYGVVDGTTVYIKRTFNANGYESERYIVLTPRTTYENGLAQYTYLESEPIPVLVNDKMSCDINFRLNLGIASGGGNYRLLRVMLAGADGSYWLLGRQSDFSGTDNTPKWFNTVGFTLFTDAGITVIDFDTFNEEEYHNLAWEAPAVPVSGKLFIWLQQFNQNSVGGDDKEIWYNNLNVEVFSFINGGYRKYTGHFNKVRQGTNPEKFFSNHDEEIKISDSPRKTFKGALLRKVGTEYELAGNFYNSAVFPTPPPANFFHPWSYIQAFSVWNQVNRIRGGFTFQALGLGGDAVDGYDRDDTPGLIHNYLIGAGSGHSNNKKLQLANYRMDCKTCKWSGVLQEVLDTTNGKVYTDTHEFKFTE